MSTNLRLLFAIPIFFLSFCGFGQVTYWQEASLSNSNSANSLKKLSIKDAKVFKLEEGLFDKKLKSISESAKTNAVVYFPDEKGKLIAFSVQEASVLSPELARKYPQIKSYKGVAVADPFKKIRFSMAPNGMQTMLLDSHSADATFMQKSASGAYILYTRKASDAIATDFVCETNEAIQSIIEAPQPNLVDMQVLKKYRVAVSATGEYTQFHGGTIAGALAAINATFTRINMVYETDLGITLELVANTDLVIYTDASTDPYNGNLNTQVQNTLNSVIGAANYDVGHLLTRASNTGDAGFIGAICDDNKKGSAFSSGVNPSGDLFDIDFVAHEMGHQFGANHTWSFESEGTQVQAEPGSGTTIMGYAGIAGVNNVASSGQDYFHYYSIKQITEFLATTSCATEIALVNNPPIITAASDYTIPKGTAFVLTGTATDSDVADVLTYTWEQIDDGTVTNTTFGPNNPSGANFRSQLPSTDPSRYFPKMSRVLQGNLTQTNPTINSAWETVSNVEREMNFALTVRDNNSEGGQVASDILKIDVVNSAGPFTVWSQNTNVSYVGGSIQEVSWDVANTTNAIVNAQKVDILLSTDGGVTFPYLVADDVPNDGAQNVLIPGEITSQARIMVKASDNVFFAVNSTNFTIASSLVVLNFSALDYRVCQPSNLVLPFTYETNSGFSETSSFSISGMPVGLTANFSQPTANIDNTPITITFSNTNAVATGEYPIAITATSASVTKQVTVNLNIRSSTFSMVNLIAPTANLVDAGINPTFQWDIEPSSTSYDIQIATDVAFTNNVEVATVLFNTYTSIGLLPNTTYYWHVKPKNECGEGVYTTASSFTTTSVDCAIETATSLPITISSSGTPTVTSTITFTEDLPIADVNVVLNVTHTYLADLTIKLTSPQGTSVVLVSNSCGETRNINATFDSSAASFVCGNNPAITGVVKPLGSLNSFIGESSRGDWVLEIKDNAGGDGGALNNFSLELCVEGMLRPDDDNDGVYDDGDDLCLGTPAGQEVNADGCPVYRFSNTNFTVSVASESCRASDDGTIQITAAMGLNYTAVITGNGVNDTGAFTNSYALEGLQAGNYTVCITGTDGVIVYEEYCFDVVVTQPDVLLVSSNLTANGKSVVLNLSGAQNYRVTLNGFTTQITSRSALLNLKNGINTLKVVTDLPCQGVYEETIIVADSPYLYPNPTEANAKIFTGIEQLNCTVWIYAMNGKLVKEFHYQNTTMELDLEISDLPQGMYVVKLKGENLKGTFKLLKK